MTDETAALESVIKEKNIKNEEASVGEIYNIGGAELESMAPVKKYDDSNDSSVVIKLTYKDHSFLFCGDIEKDAEKDICDSGADISADVLKVAHHGSATSSSEDFLDEVSADYAVILTGPDKNNLPRAEVLNRLESYGMDILRTDHDGTILFSSDGKNMDILTEKRGRYK